MSPYPDFGTRSTVVVFGCRRALSTVTNCPEDESRPSRKDLDLLIPKDIHRSKFGNKVSAMIILS